MDLSKYSLQELINIRDEYFQDVTDLRNELLTVEAAVLKTKKMELFNKLKNKRRSSFVAPIMKNDDSSSSSSSDSVSTAEKKHDYYKSYTNVIVNDMSVKSVEPKTTEFGSFLYEYNASIDNLTFEMKYISNLPINSVESEYDNEIIEDLQINILTPNLQCDAQTGLDFFFKNPTYIGAAILFLTRLNELHEIRRRIIKSLLTAYQDYIKVGIDGKTGKYIIICTGKVYTKEFFNIKWALKWDPVTCTAKDSMKVQVKVEEEQLFDDIKPLFSNLCNPVRGINITEDDKLKIFNNVLIAVKDADFRLNSSSESS